MATVEIADTVIWMKHIDGDAQLVAVLRGLGEDQTVRLLVGDHDGVWTKMNDGTDGRPVDGIKPLDDAREHWLRLFREQRGARVAIRLVKSIPQHWKDASDAERDAAWEAFKALMKAGWRSSTDHVDRSLLHDS